MKIKHYPKLYIFIIIAINSFVLYKLNIINHVFIAKSIFLFLFTEYYLIIKDKVGNKLSIFILIIYFYFIRSFFVPSSEYFSESKSMFLLATLYNFTMLYYYALCSFELLNEKMLKFKINIKLLVGLSALQMTIAYIYGLFVNIPYINIIDTSDFSFEIFFSYNRVFDWIRYFSDIFYAAGMEEILIRFSIFVLLQRIFCKKNEFSIKSLFVLNTIWVLLHFNIFFVPLYSAITFIVSLTIKNILYYWIMIKEKNILIPIILHFISNILIFGYSYS